MLSSLKLGGKALSSSKLPRPFGPFGAQALRQAPVRDTEPPRCANTAEVSRPLGDFRPNCRHLCSRAGGGQVGTVAQEDIGQADSPL